MHLSFKWLSLIAIFLMVVAMQVYEAESCGGGGGGKGGGGSCGWKKEKKDKCDYKEEKYFKKEKKEKKEKWEKKEKKEKWKKKACATVLSSLLDRDRSHKVKSTRDPFDSYYDSYDPFDRPEPRKREVVYVVYRD